MYLSGQNLSLLKNSIEFNNGDINSDLVPQKDKALNESISSKKHEVDSAVFVQTNKDSRTSKVPSIKIELGKNLSNLVIVGKSVNDIKSNFENIDQALNIESESEMKLQNERKEAIDKNVLEIKTILNETTIEDKKIFLSTFKLNVKMEVGNTEPYKAKIDFAKAFENFNLDFDGVENNLDKRFTQIKSVNKSLSAIDAVQNEVEMHTKVLKRQMDKFISAGRESTLFHLNSRLDDSSLVNKMKLKASLFTDPKNLALTQINTNSASVLNLLP